MKRIWLAPVLALSAVALVWAEDPVYFADAALQAAVEEELWVTDPTPTDMLGLTCLHAGNRDITDVTGLEYATNLDDLQLPANHIGGISPLAGLSNLRTLVLNNNEIGDISALAGLTKLEYLDVHDNLRISNLTPLAGLSALETLVIRGNRISDVSPLAGLSKMDNLDLSSNQISDVSPLCSLTSLSCLDLRDNPLSIDSYNIYIPRIIANNPGAYIQPSASSFSFSISATAGGSVVAPGIGEFTYRYGETILLKAVADPCFVFVGWSGLYPAGQNPQYVTAEEDLHIRACFQSVLPILHVCNDGSGDSASGDPPAGGTRANGTPEHPFRGIQEAVEVAADGVSILVHPGTYQERIVLPARGLRLIGLSAGDPNGAAWPVVEGTRNNPIVEFSRGPGPECLLTGFVITRGSGQPAGAILCSGASPTITHCLIVGNRSMDPNGAVVYCRDSKAVLTNCTIADNYAGWQGAALRLVDSDVQMSNSILWGDAPSEVLAGGISRPVIQYCDVQGWWPDYGNIYLDPLFARRGAWVHPDDPEEPLPPEDPQALWRDGDYHLQSQTGRWDPLVFAWVQDPVSSPCIDRGEKTAPVDSEPAPHGGIVNLGAYGGTAEASQSPLAAGSP